MNLHPKLDYLELCQKPLVELMQMREHNRERVEIEMLRGITRKEAVAALDVKLLDQLILKRHPTREELRQLDDLMLCHYVDHLAQQFLTEEDPDKLAEWLMDCDTAEQVMNERVAD